MRDFYFNYIMDKTVPLALPVTEKNYYNSTHTDLHLGLSGESSTHARIYQDFHRKYSLPRVPRLSNDLTQNEPDVILIKSLERLRELKLRDQSIHGSQERDRNARKRTGKTEPGNRKIGGKGEQTGLGFSSKGDPAGSPNLSGGDLTSELDKTRFYEIIENILEKEAKRHGLVFR